MVLAFLLGLFIFFIYKSATAGDVFGQLRCNTDCSVAYYHPADYDGGEQHRAVPGMVGALSIVRFRTAIKEPMDIAFLFWAIAVGIVLAAGLIPLAVFGSIFIGAVLLAFSKKKTLDSPYILVVHCENSESRNRRGFL